MITAEEFAELEAGDQVVIAWKPGKDEWQLLVGTISIFGPGFAITEKKDGRKDTRGINRATMTILEHEKKAPEWINARAIRSKDSSRVYLRRYNNIWVDSFSSTNYTQEQIIGWMRDSVVEVLG